MSRVRLIHGRKSGHCINICSGFTATKVEGTRALHALGKDKFHSRI
jgi:hypothetical protein